MFNNSIFRLIIVLSVTLACTFSCTLKTDGNTGSSNWDKKNLRKFNTSDTAYFNAIEEARNNLDLFTTFYSDKGNNGYEFYVKSKFVESGHIEHMWLVVTRLQNDSVVGVLDNVPNKIKKNKYRDTVTIARMDIEDWIIYKGDSIILGNYISNAVDR